MSAGCRQRHSNDRTQSFQHSPKIVIIEIQVFSVYLTNVEPVI